MHRIEVDLNIRNQDHGGMGSIACFVSAVFFGVMAVFVKLAYGDGVELDTLLLIRFGMAGSILLVIAHVTGRLARLSRQAVVTGLLMGAVGYAAQSTLYFESLTRIPATQAALVFSVYPLLVMVTAVAIRREQASRKRAAALLVALVGVALVLGGASTKGFDLLGSACAFGSAVVYTGYIMVSDRVVPGDPIAFAALVCTGAFGTFLGWSAFQGGPHLGFDARGWLWLVLIALVGTVAAILLFFAGLALVGPTIAALVSIVEPVVTVGGAALVFSESMSVGQILGGVLVIGSVLVVQWPTRGWRKPAADASAMATVH